MVLKSALKLEERLLVVGKEKARKELDRPSYDIINLLRSKSRRKTFADATIDQVITSLELFFAYQQVIYTSIIDSETFDSSKDALTSLKQFSYFISSDIGVDELSLESSSKKKFQNNQEIDFNLGDNAIRNILLEKYLSNINSFCDSSADVVAITNGFFQWVKRNSEVVYESKKFGELNSLISKRKTNRQHSIDNIVGNNELIRIISQSLRLLFLYDREIKENPHLERYGSFTQRILAYGSPGTGKSLTISAMSKQAEDLAFNLKKPFQTIYLSNAVKSKYFSESAQKLRSIFNEVENGESIYLLIADDIDTFVFGRTQGEYSENISILGELIKCLESVESVNLGNYLLLASTNLPQRLDPALFRRFQSSVEVRGPESVNDYIDLMRIKLGNYIDDCLIKVDDWRIVGKMLYDNNISGSIVSDIATTISDEITSVILPDELYTQDSATIQNKLQDYYQVMTQKRFLQVMNDKLLDYR